MLFAVFIIRLPEMPSSYVIAGALFLILVLFAYYEYANRKKRRMNIDIYRKRPENPDAWTGLASPKQIHQYLTMICCDLNLPMDLLWRLSPQDPIRKIAQCVLYVDPTDSDNLEMANFYLNIEEAFGICLPNDLPYATLTAGDLLICCTNGSYQKNACHQRKCTNQGQ
jgi:hypothetical protein